MPGYTHFQRATSRSRSGHHLLAWVEMLERDRSRFRVRRRAGNAVTARRGALAGSTLDLPPPPGPVMRNSLDAVADRDFALDYLYACALLPLAPVADRGGARALDDCRVRLRPASGVGRHRLVDDAAQAEPRRRGARPRQGRNGDRHADGAARRASRACLSRTTATSPRTSRRRSRTRREVRLVARRPDRARRDLELDRERLAAACADPLLLATDAAEALVREGVPFRDAHERVAEAVHDGSFTAHARAAPRPAPGPATSRRASRRPEHGSPGNPSPQTATLGA